MRIQDLPRRIKANDQLVVCFDVTKNKLDRYAIHTRTGAPDRVITVMIQRRADQSEEQLNELSSYAEEHRLDGLCVVCGPEATTRSKEPRPSGRGINRILVKTHMVDIVRSLLCLLQRQL